MFTQSRALECVAVWLITQGVFASDAVDLRPGYAGLPGGVIEKTVNEKREAIARSGASVRDALEFDRRQQKKSLRARRSATSRHFSQGTSGALDRTRIKHASHDLSSLGTIGARVLLLGILGKTEAWVRLFQPVKSEESPDQLLRLQCSCRLVERYFARAIEHDEIVDDTILGTKINGKGHVSGKIQVTIEPNDHEIRFHLLFAGVCRSQTQGLNSVIILQNTAETHFQARKQFVWNSQGLTAHPATATAETRSTTHQINSTLPGLRGRIATQVAQQRVAESRAQADAISSQHSADRIRRALDANFDRSSAWVRFVSQQIPASSFVRRGTRLEISSTSDALQIVLRRRGTLVSEVRTTCTPLPQGCDVAVQVHRETFRNVVRDPITLLAVAGAFDRILSSGRLGVPQAVTSGVSRDQNANWQLTGSRDGAWLVVQHSLPSTKIATGARHGSIPLPAKPVAASWSLPALEVR